MAWRRQWCYLCDLPKTPWAVVWDFSEAVCRGCVNFEGTHRIEPLLEAARRLRHRHGENRHGHHETRHGHHETRHGRGETWHGHRESSHNPGDNRHGHGETWHNHGDSRHSHGETSHNPGDNRHGHGETWHNHGDSWHGHRESSHNPGDNRHGHNETWHNHGETWRNPGDSRHGHSETSHNPGDNRHGHGETWHDPGEIHHNHGEIWRTHGEIRHCTGPLPPYPEEPPPARRGPPVPLPCGAECLAELSAAMRGRAEAWPGKPPAVRERLAALAGCAPFNVRFRKDHALVGRVFAFDAAPRPGFEFELKLFAEYPCGSGSVYAGVLGLAKQMFQDCLRAPGKAISSGYKYLEYEKRRGSGDWRLLGELFTEAVRFFRHPPAPDALPQQHPPPPRRRRKASPEPDEPPPQRVPPPAPFAEEPPGERPAEGSAALCCGLCRRRLEDTHFVQCPAVPAHRFCFPCSRRAIRARGGRGGEVNCPSGGRCPLASSGLPWAFMQGEIAAILAGDVCVKRERDP